MTRSIDLGKSPRTVTTNDSGNMIVDTITLVVDATNDRVGIGTASPGYKLDVTNSARIQGDVHMFGQVRNYSGDFTLRNGSSDGDINFNVNDGGVDTTVMTIDGATANVGIGTAPNKKLHIYRNDSNTDAQILVEQAGAGDATINFLKTGVYSWMTGIDNTDNNYKISGSGEDLNTNNYLAIDTSGNTTLAGDLTVSGGQVTMPAVATRDKYRLWNSSNWAIGMDDAMSFGGLGDYAITFQMNNQANRGFWWGDTSHTDAQGAMALTTQGKLTVAHSARIGYGETDTTTPGATHALDVNGSIQDSQGNVRVLERTGITSTPYALPANSSGKYFSCGTGSGTITIDSSNCETGQIITIYNHLDTSLTISWTNMTNGVYIAGSTTSKGTSGSVTLVGKGLVTILNDVSARLIFNGNVS